MSKTIRFLFCIAILVLSLSHTGDCQVANTNKVTLSGYVEDATTGEKLPGATIIIAETKKGTVTNNYGFFSITINSGEVTVYVTYTGFGVLTQKIQMTANSQQVFKLQPNNNLQEVVVSTKRQQPIQEQTQMSKVTVPVALIKSMPRFLGETDVMKTLQLLPGVAQGAEGTSGVIVRGGSPDQNLILLDGTPVYNPSHVFGIFSSFNSDALKSVELYKGGFPARFGSRLSSVIDLVMKDGNMKEFHGEGAIGLLASRLTLEGPIKKNKTSFLVSGRRTYLDLLATPIVKSASEGVVKGLGVYFYDANFKLHHIVSDKDRLFLSVFSGHDFFKVRTEDKGTNSVERIKTRVGWGNTLATLRWNHIFNQRLFANTLINFTQYRFVSDLSYYSKVDNDIDNFGAKYFSGIKDYGARIDFDYRPLPEHSIKFGAAATIHVFTPGAATLKASGSNTNFIDTSFNNYSQKSGEISLYAEDDWQVSSKLKMNIGFHASTFKAKSKWYPNIQPRLGLRYLLPGDVAFKASYTHMYQYVHLLTNNATTLPTDLWVPSTDKIKPMFSQQIAAGFSRTVFKDKYEISLEGYYKTMDGVIEYKDGASYLNSSVADWDTKVEAGKGRVWGIELLLQKKVGKANGWIGYTLSKNDRQFPEINYGKRFFYKYDRRHDFEIVINYKLGKNVDVSASWQFQTAAPFTLPQGEYESAVTDPTDPYFYSGTLYQYKGRNEYRLLNYHRLDAGITWRKQKKKYEKSWNFSLYNMYNRQNPFYYYVDSQENTGKAKLNGITILPVVPSISYSFKF